jgi:hypothetical protein
MTDRRRSGRAERETGGPPEMRSSLALRPMSSENSISIPSPTFNEGQDGREQPANHPLLECSNAFAAG